MKQGFLTIVHVGHLILSSCVYHYPDMKIDIDLHGQMAILTQHNFYHIFKLEIIQKLKVNFDISISVSISKEVATVRMVIVQACFSTFYFSYHRI